MKVTQTELQKEFERQARKAMINPDEQLKSHLGGYLDPFVNDKFNQWIKCATYLGALK